MKHVRMLGICVMAVFAVGVVTSASASAFSFRWHVNGAEASGQEVTGAGGEFKLEAGTKTVVCTGESSTGTVKALGEDEATLITFTGCTANSSACKAFSSGQTPGTIVVSAIKTLLVERETSAKAKVLADEFKENATTKRFVTLEFEANGGGECENFPTTEVKGEVAAEVINSTQSLNFPSPELKGNTLKAFGVAAKLTGSSKQTLVGGGTIEGV
jgi:hypothetical protein